MSVIKIKNYNGYDDYYITLKEKGNNWQEILDIIEQYLDDKWFENDEKVNGIKVEFEIVDKMPEDIEYL